MIRLRGVGSVHLSNHRSSATQARSALDKNHAKYKNLRGSRIFVVVHLLNFGCTTCSTTVGGKYLRPPQKSSYSLYSSNYSAVGREKNNWWEVPPHKKNFLPGGESDNSSIPPVESSRGRKKLLASLLTYFAVVLEKRKFGWRGEVAARKREFFLISQVFAPH